MAITLDELLGRNQDRTSAETSVDRFPSYDDYTASRRMQEPAADGYEGYSYNFETKPYTAPRSEEAARAYEASRPYVAPSASEYRNGGYARNAFDGAAAAVEKRYASEERYDAYRREYGAPSDCRTGETAGRGLYEFTVNDAERASGSELYDRLSGTSVHSDERTARASYSENYAEKYRADNRAKTRRKLHFSLKAKLLIAAYVAVMVLITVLIIVNAKPLNNGTAQVPSAADYSAAAVSVEETENHISPYASINLGYEVRTNRP